MSLSSILGLDIGGANLKAAHTSGDVAVRPFALWKQPERLAVELSALLEKLPPSDSLAVTMTAELCDCFASKAEGVNDVLDAVARVVAGSSIRVWTNTGEWLSIAQARSQPLIVAAANWLALATFAGRFCRSGPGLLIDIGSTTTDIIPLVDGVPVPRGRTDLDRLASRELVYTGVSRTPLCAVLPSIRWRDSTFAPAAELFATTRDAYLLLKEMPEVAEDRNTADGRPATRHNAHARVARMLCADVDVLPLADAVALAEQVQHAQLSLLSEALAAVAARLPGPPHLVIVSGSGEFLARRLIAEALPGAGIVSLSEQLGPKLSEAACAYALVMLAAEGGGEWPH